MLCLLSLTLVLECLTCSVAMLCFSHFGAVLGLALEDLEVVWEDHFGAPGASGGMLGASRL